jgi:hypothetical protein
MMNLKCSFCYYANAFEKLDVTIANLGMFYSAYQFYGELTESRQAVTTLVISVRLSACINVAPTECISLRFYIENFYENLLGRSDFVVG